MFAFEISDKLDLEKLEAVIERGLTSFIETGEALQKIRVRRLYRQHAPTFEGYCRKRWGFKAARARQLIAAVGVVRDISSESVTQVTLPASEKHTRPLVALEPEQRREVWSEAVATAPEGKITAEHVAAVARKAAPHVAHNTGVTEWYTPPAILDVARAAMGGIDLDPASCAKANETVQAERYYTAEDNGLIQPWSGRIWLNPPYASGVVDRFAEKLASEVGLGRVGAACVLINNGTETRWFDRLLSVAAAVCFPTGRVRFIDREGNPGGTPLQGQALVYVGTEPRRFAHAARDLGRVLGPVEAAAQIETQANEERQSL